MMAQMRRNTKIIMIATALAFAALMLFEWGMDASGRSAGGLGEIGSVNGTPVPYDQYNLVYRNLYDQAQQAQPDTPLTSQQIKTIEDQAFDELVTQILIEQELKRRSVRVSDEEIVRAAQFNPPPQFTAEPALQTDGRFDLQKYQQFLATQPDAYLLQIESYYRDIIPRSKLLRQVSAGVYVSDNELWRRWKDLNETVEVRYIPLNPSQRIPDEQIELTDQEIRSYYEANPDDYRQPASARVIVTVLDKTPTPADTAAQYELAVEIMESIRLGDETFEDAAARESSDDFSAEQGGDLGVFTPGTMVPEFDSTVFAAPVGQMVGPVVTTFGNHIIEVTERWAQDSAQARHILIPHVRTDASELEMLTLADSLEELGEQLPLAEAAAQVGLTTSETTVTSDFAFLQGAGQVSEGADWAIEEAEVGEVSPLFETPTAFYAFELISRQEAGILPLDVARISIEQTLRFEKKQRQVQAEGAEIVARIRNGDALPNIAAELGLEVQVAGPFSRNEFAPGLGRQNAAIGAAFGLDLGEVSDVVSTPTNSFIIELLTRSPADSLAWEDQKEFQRGQLTESMSQTRLGQWIEGLRESAKIIDLRDEVLNVEDEGLQQGMPGGFGF